MEIVREFLHMIYYVIFTSERDRTFQIPFPYVLGLGLIGVLLSYLRNCLPMKHETNRKAERGKCTCEKAINHKTTQVLVISDCQNYDKKYVFL